MTKKRKQGPLDIFFQKMNAFNKQKKSNPTPKTVATKLSLPIKYNPYKGNALLEELSRYGSSLNPITEVVKGKGKPRRINEDAHVLNGAMYAGVAMSIFNRVELLPTTCGKYLIKTAISTFNDSIYDLIKANKTSSSSLSTTYTISNDDYKAKKVRGSYNKWSLDAKVKAVKELVSRIPLDAQKGITT